MIKAPGSTWIANEARRSLERLLPGLQAGYAAQDPEAWPIFEARLSANFPQLFELLLYLYGERYDFFYHLQNILATARECGWLARPT